MSQQNPTIIVGHLDDSELTKSIDKLVAEVATKTSGMAEDFTQAIDKMKFAMKDFAITQKVSVDLMKEAWRDMSKSFDAMVAAQSAATGSGKGSGKGKVYAPDTVGALEQEISLEKEKRREMLLGSAELDKQNILLEKRRKLLKEETSSPYQKIEKSFSKEFGAANTMSTKTLQQAEDKLKRLLRLQGQFKTAGLIDESKMNRLQNAIDNVQRKIEKLKKTTPKSLNDVLGMDANSIDQIAAKMRALKMVQIDPNNTREVNRLGKAYADLKRQQAKMLGQNIQLTHSNNYLAQSFGYIRNRIVYALTLGAITNFVKQLYEIRGQYELLERSLGVLVGSFEKGTQIFNELNEMAIKSPFTLIELGTAAKQLTAYNFAANEVVDTTRRLADISAALGVPMERLTYNLGQIKAQGVLNARDARDFANAGLAIVPMLAKMYTEQKTFGDEMVTTAQVYDMMSKKMVTYSDVLKVLYRVTDEGGKFFDFQAKQADTLRVQMANLTLAYNNMLNEIGSENQGILSGMVSGLKTLLKHWRDIRRILLTLITTFGVYKTVSTLAVGAQTISAWISLARSIKSAKDAMALFNLTISANPLGLLASILAAVIGYFVLFKNEASEVSQEVEMFGENGAKLIKKVDTLQKVLNGTNETSSVYKKTLEELSTITSEYGVQLDKENAKRSDINKAIGQTIQLIKEESAERQRANQLEQTRSTYEGETEAARKELQETIAKSSNISGGGVDSKYLKAIKENSEAVAAIVDEVVTNNIHLIVNKSGEELEKGINDIYGIINTRLKKVGISGGDIQQILSGLLSSTSAVEKFAISIANANEKLERRGKIIERNKQAAEEATQATMTFSQKVDANARALRNNTEDAISLYNRIYDIVKIAKENHVINFDLKLSAEKPPKWMLDKSLPELQQLAERFTAIAQSGGHVKGYNREGTYERGLMYASAARIKQEEEERNARNKDHKTRTKQSDEIAKAIKNEISLVKQLQSAYDTLTKKGDSHANAIAKVQDLYGKTIDLLNKDMDKFGLPRLDLSIIKGNNHNEVLAFFEKLRDVLESKGLSNLERMEAVEGVVKEFRLKADTYNLDMITKGLNNELGKLKDEYELAVELDANPELGNIFADIFDIRVQDLPHSIEEYASRAVDALNEAIKQRGDNVVLPTLFLTKDDIEAFREMSKEGKLNKESLKEIEDEYNKIKDLRKKAAVDVSKIASDYIHEYGDLSAQITLIEQEKNTNLTKLNDVYNTEALRQTQRYVDAKFAIEDGARRKQAKAAFEALKKEADYERFFTAIDTLTRTDAVSIKNKIKQGIIDVFKNGGLTVSQFKKEIKALEDQFDKLTQNNQNWFVYMKDGFNGLIQKAKETGNEIEALGAKMGKEGKVDKKDQEYLDSFGKIFWGKDGGEGGLKNFSSLMQEFGNDFEGLGKQTAAAGQNMQGAASDFQGAVTIVDMIIKNIHQTVQAIGSVIEELDSMRSEDNKISNSYWQNFQKYDNYASSGWENLKSGNIGGALGDTANSFIVLYRQITKFDRKQEKINKSIKESQREVKNLELAYKDLQDAINNSYGAEKWAAQQMAQTNKELQLAELKRQLQLEESRKSKIRDIDKIQELKGQIKDLELEIKNATNEIVSDLLGISSVGDAAENLVLSMINAFRQGEKYMEEFDDAYENMINNMIAKTFASLIIGDKLKELWDSIKQKAEERGKGEKENAMSLEKQLEEARNRQVTKEGKAAKEGEYSSEEEKQADLRRLEKQLEEARKVYADAIKPTPDDIKDATQQTEGWRDYVQETFLSVMEGLGITAGDQKKSNLSALQQGIQGVTEDTAGAVEAYLNGMSQQAYLRNDLLTQIRDAIVGMDIDVQTATMGEILLQLRSSYEVQMAIHGILEGVLTPSGRAFSVELAS